MGFAEPQVIIEHREHWYLCEIAKLARELVNLMDSKSQDKEQEVAIAECKQELSDNLHWLERG